MKWKCNKCGQTFDSYYHGHFKTPELWEKYKSVAPFQIPGYPDIMKEIECDGQLEYAGGHPEVVEFYEREEYQSKIRGFVRELLKADPRYYPSEARAWGKKEDYLKGTADIDGIVFYEEVHVRLTVCGYTGEEDIYYDLEDVLVEEKRTALIEKMVVKRDKLFAEREQEKKDRKNEKLQKELAEKAELARLKAKYPEEE